MSRGSTSARLVRRPSRVTPAVMLAVALGAVGGTGIWLLVTHLTDGTWPAAASGAVDSVAGTRVDEPAVQITMMLLAAIGLALVLAAVVPGRPSRVLVLDDDVPGGTAMSRRDLARWIQRRAENVDGVRGAEVTIRRRAVDVVITAAVDDPTPVVRAAGVAVERAFRELRPAAPSRVRVRTRRQS